MIEIAFSDAEVMGLQALQMHPHHVVRRKALMLVLKSQKIPHYKIAQVTDVCENTVRQCFETYQQGGIEKLKTLNFRRPQSSLKPFEAEVREYFEKTPPATIAQACTDIKKRTGVSLKNTQMRTYIKSIGVFRRKVNSIPAKANIEAQKKFHDEELQPRLEAARAGKTHRVLRRCSALCPGRFPGLFVELRSHVCENAKRSATIQCAGRIKCRHKRTHHYHERHLHHVIAGLRIIESDCKRCGYARYAGPG
jgi:transposase